MRRISSDAREQQPLLWALAKTWPNITKHGLGCCFVRVCRQHRNLCICCPFWRVSRIVLCGRDMLGRYHCGRIYTAGCYSVLAQPTVVGSEPSQVITYQVVRFCFMRFRRWGSLGTLSAEQKLIGKSPFDFKHVTT